MSDTLPENTANSARQFDAAVVIPTLLRPSLLQAVRSVFAQQGISSVQVLIGIDKPLGDVKIIDQIKSESPANCLVSVLDLGYSTSVRHGGIHLAQDGGALRTILSYAANSRYVAYLDDDNWWANDHLATLKERIQGFDWAFSKRWFVDPNTLQPICVDEWESLGPDAGVYQAKFGGFVDPNTLMIDKIACEPALRLWCFPMPGEEKGMSADRMVFRYLRQQAKWCCTGKATCFYRLNADERHPECLQAMHNLPHHGPAIRMS